MASDTGTSDAFQVDMAEIGSIFIQAYAREAKSWSESALFDIERFIRHNVVECTHNAFITTTGIESIRNELFKVEIVSDFILSISFRFFSFWGRNQSGIDELNTILATSLTQPTTDDFSGDESNEVLLPIDYDSRYRNCNDMELVLKHNRWFTVICLIRLFIEVSSGVVEKPQDNDTQG
jgi:hypothetical protein